MIYDVGEKKPIYQRTLPLEQVRYLFERAYEYGKIHIQTYTDQYVISEYDTKEGRAYEKQVKTPRKIVKDIFEELNGQEPCKVLAIAHDYDRKHLEGFRDSMLAYCEGKMDVCFSCYEFLEFMPLGINKGNSIRWMCEYFNIPLCDTIAVGDADNDITMIQTAGIGAVMQNAEDHIKQYGNYITEKNNNEGGVAEVIRKFMLEEQSWEGKRMAEKNYVAYVGTYTHGESKGIHIYDLDVENGRMTERKVVPNNNPY